MRKENVMPLYSLYCPKCEHRCERMCDVKKREKQSCPKCGTKMEVQIDKTSFILKGDCWGKDGYTK